MGGKGGKRTVVPVFRLYRQGGKYGVQRETGEKLKKSGGGRQRKTYFWKQYTLCTVLAELCRTADARQILKYMVCIWENEAAEAKRTTMTSDKKDFRYLPIYPIVYYEGSGEWTAAESLKDRVLMGDLFKAYIPDFTYKLVRTQDYSKEELLSKEDAISLLMLLNKIQQAKDFEELSGLPTKKLNDILQRAPVDVAEIIVSVVRSLCRRLNLTEEETTNLMKEMEAGNMGFLWENMEKMDIQLERRNTEEAKQEAEEAKQEAAEARQEAAIQKQKAEEAEKNIHDLCCALIAAYQNQGIDREAAKKQLMRTAGLKEEIMDELFESLWHQ